MTLEELLAALGKLPEGSKFAEVIKTLIAAKEAELATKSTQYKTLTKTLKDTEDKLKAANERVSKLSDHIGIDEDVEDLDAALDTAAKNNKKGGDEVLLKRLEKLERDRKKEKETSDALLATERGKRHDAMKNQAIIAALTAGKAVSPEKLVALLQSSVMVNDDDTLVFTDAKGTELSINDGVAAWLKANPEFAGNPQNAGGGSAGGGGSSTDAGAFGKQLAEQNAAAQKAAADAQDHYFK